MVGTRPRTKVSDVLRVQADGLSSNFVQFIISEDDFGGINCGGEDAELRLVAHLKNRSAVRTSHRLLD